MLHDRILSMENEFFIGIFNIQFAVAQRFYFLFLSLIIGLSLILAMMESVYVLTGKVIFQKMTQFWGKFFAMNIAMGLAIGILMQWQFGTQWHNYAALLGDIFCGPRTLIGKISFLVEVGLMWLFFFGWQRFNQVTHLGITWLMAIGANFCALLILFANTPIHSDPHTQLHFIHIVAASYVTAAMFVLGTSGYYLFKKSATQFAKRSFLMAAVFSGIAILIFIMLGNDSSLFISMPMLLANVSVISFVPVMISLSGFIFLYSLLMFKFAKWGPQRLAVKRYHFECV